MHKSALQALSSWVKRNLPVYLILLQTSVAKDNITARNIRPVLSSPTCHINVRKKQD